jgi:hypothetical protein
MLENDKELEVWQKMSLPEGRRIWVDIIYQKGGVEGYE